MITPLILILAAAPLAAATLHVATTGGCPNHATVGTTCSSNSTCGAIATPCCTLEAADGPAIPGDTIELHHGTYTGSVVIGQNSYSAVIDTPNIIIRATAGDSPILDGEGVVNGCIYTTQDGLTLDGITCSNHICGTEVNLAGIVHTNGSAGSRFKRMTLNVALPPGRGEFACGAFRLMGSGAGNTIIENNTITGHMGHTFLLENHVGSSGVIIRNNSVLLDRASTSNDPYRVMAVKGAYTNTPVAFYGNRITRTAQLEAAGAMLFMRETPPEATVYAFNNICVNCNTAYAIYTQDNSCPAGGSFTDQDVWVFNNTMTGAGYGVSWQNYWSSMRVVNNIFDGASHGVWGDTSASENCAHGTGTDRLWSASTDKFTNNIMERRAGGKLFGGIASNAVVDASGSTISSSSVTQRDAANHLTASTPPGSNDPLGQGAGMCSITTAGQTINCAVDINGTPRGLVWDIGADQFGTGAATCGNGIVEGTESCDGEALGGATCEGLGFSGGNLTCTPECALDTSACGSPVPSRVTFIDVGSAVVGAWVTINGHGFGTSRGTSGVLFGSVAATSVPVWTDTKIIVQVPLGAGSPVVVQSGGVPSNPVALSFHAGRVLWVAKTGSDANTCTSESAACLTVDRARTIAVPGDVIVIRGGSYCESSGGAGLYVRPTNSGTAAQPITYLAYPGESPTIGCCGSCGGNTMYLDGDFIQVSGLRTTGARGTGIVVLGDFVRVANCESFGNNQLGYASTSGSGINVQIGASNTKILGCSVHDNGSVDNLDHGMYLKGQDMEIAFNAVFNHSAGYGIQLYEGSGATFERAQVHSNLIYANRNAGITINLGASNARVFNNEIRNNTRYGIYVGGTGSSAPSGTMILSNTIHGNDQTSAGFQQVRIASGTGTILRNNVVTGSNGLMIRRDSGATGGAIDYQLYGSNNSNSFNWGGTNYNFSGWQTVSAQDAASIVGDPNYAGAATSDLRLGPGSPALNSAELGTTPARDREGRVRPQGSGPDRGAYEAAATGLPAVRNLIRIDEAISGSGPGPAPGS